MLCGIGYFCLNQNGLYTLQHKVFSILKVDSTFLFFFVYNEKVMPKEVSYCGNKKEEY